MRIAVAQIDPIVGAFEANVKKIKEAYKRACSKRARILLTPELAICGYPPHDLIERPEIYERNENAVRDLIAETRGQNCALVVGHIDKNPLEFGRSARNVATVLEDGKRIFQQAKSLLPTYDVFDEARYFAPAREIQTWQCGGRKIALAICEDLWAHDPDLSTGRRLYENDPTQKYAELGAELILAIASSPYEWGKRERREKLHSEIAQTLRVPLVYVNQIGATDEVLFDGGSFALDATGKLAGRLPLFRTSFGVLDWNEKLAWDAPSPDAREDEVELEIDVLHRGLIVGIREYFRRTGFKTAVIGLSGGIDSSVVAALAAEALGPENVLGVGMPGPFSAPMSLEDAELLAGNLGIRFEVRPIKFLFSVASRELGESRSGLAPVAMENLQSRLRGMVLMTLANHYGALVLTTGNKSELATGYCTLYGDMVGALAPLGDLYKIRVYELARQINKKGKNPIPSRSIERPPSAELYANQTDQETLPAYEQLDWLLENYLERGASVSELEVQAGKRPGKKDWVRETLRRVEVNEYKRRQAAPVLKVSRKAFGIGRRIPIAKIWDQ